MSGFHEVQFPPEVSYGASGGPGYSTSVITTVSGHERRNVNWSVARGRWNVGTGIRNRDHIAACIAFFRARKGKAHGFRFKDWTDYQGFAQPIGTGDGETQTFQLVKHYASGGEIETRTIRKPVAGTVEIYEDGEATPGAWVVDTTTGIVSFAVAPAEGVALTADFEFDVPVRFDADNMDVSIETYEMGEWDKIPVVEIRV